jgi:SMC interacting uncharacterized protein involved in chromosome segregation
MVSMGSKSEATSTSVALEALEAVRSLQQLLQKIDARLQHVEKVTKHVVETHKQIDDKLDGLYKLLQQWNSPSEHGSQENLRDPSPTLLHHTKPHPLPSSLLMGWLF